MKLRYLRAGICGGALVLVVGFAGCTLPSNSPSGGSSHPAPQSTVPDTPAGQAFSAWLTAFNTANSEQLRTAMKQFREPRPVEGELDFRRATGGFDLKNILESTPTRIRVLVKERDSDQMAEGQMEVEPAPPHRIARWDLRVVPRPAEFALPRMTEAEALKALKDRIDELVRQERFSGSVLVARHGKPVFSDARGMQDREKRIPNRLDTKYNLGSMNKMFTAVAVAQLAQQGKLKFTDTVGKHVPGYPNADVANKVTLHHLLSHTGGTGDIFGPEFAANLKELKDPKDYIALYGKRAPQFEPGSSWAYSNYGMVLVGAIIERASGMSYYDYVRKNVYQRAGMNNSDSYWKDEDTPNLAKGYTGGEGSLRYNYDSRPMRGSPAGGGYSTCEDLLRFATALTGHKLLDAEHTNLLTTSKPGTPGDSYGYGFGISNDGGVRSFGHGGGAPGINADLKIFPDSGYVIAVMGNLDPPAASRISDFIAARLPVK
jgi:D-alanyl-D-alanine carboxypeptidase